MKTLYLAKEPDAGVRDDLSRISGEITIVDCLNAYGDYYRKKGYNCISKDEFFDSNGMKFDVVIGNPPYNGGLYEKFMKSIGNIVSDTGYFDILLPSYTFTRKKSMKTCKNLVLLESIDFTAGHHFASSIDGAWVTRFRGRLGKTGNSSIQVILPDGSETVTTLDDINPTSEKFIKPNGLTVEDISILRKVLTSTIKFESHKDTKISGSFAYIRPTLKYISKPHPAAGSFNLHGVCNSYSPDMKNGWYVTTETDEQSNNILKIYIQSKLFNYINWLMISDYPMISESYISLLPDVSNVTYKNESKLYEQFGLSDSEIQRIESIF